MVIHKFASSGLAKVKSMFLLSLLSTFTTVPALADDSAATQLTFTQDESGQLSPSSPRLVLKNGNTLVVLDKAGMIDARPGSPYGLYEDDTRFLSRWQIVINGKEPTLIKAFTDRGYQGSFIYTIGDEVLVERDLVLLNGMSEKIRIRSFVDHPLKFKVAILHASDFKDMFEVRGIKREHFGKLLGASVLSEKPDNGDGAKLVEKSSYLGVDNLERSTYVTASQPQPTRSDRQTLEYDISLPARGSQTIEARVDTSNTPETIRSKFSYASASEAADRAFAAWDQQSPSVSSNWVLLNDMIKQSASDLFLLQQTTPKGPCLAAGLPWYSCAFGRDQCITALQTLPFMPSVAREVLNVLAAYQGKVHDPVTEEEPGRIMHELRLGDMARSKEIAFRPYYGTVDATPLFIMLLCRYVDATGDTALAKSLWPNVEAALAYVEKCSAPTDGFLYYGGKGGAALSNQAWKDSGDSIMHKDGKLATAPIAVCEVQGYLYDALSGSAKLASRLGHGEQAARLDEKAAALKANFKKRFWLPDERIVALALDGTGMPCDVVASNAGHLLGTGIIDDEIADAIAERLMKDDMFSGWGIRTLSSREVRYNPISYHDGSIWPHDNAMIVEGLAARGKMQAACTVMESLVQSAKTSSDARLPELFSGFPRSEFSAPVPYAVSCVPQAWAAGSLYQMLKSILGVSLVDNKIHVNHPRLPASINYLSIDGLRSGNSKVNLVFKRDAATNAVTVSASSDEVDIDK